MARTVDRPAWGARHPIAALMLFLALVLLGVLAAFRLPVSLVPGAEAAGVTIETEYSGSTPDKIEELITRPMEQSISVVGGVENLFSVTEFGKSRIYVEFATGTNQDLRSLEMRERIDLVASGFPREVRYPLLLKYDPSQRPVLIIAMDSPTRSLTEVRDLVDRRLKKALQALPGVSEVNVAGGRVREVRIDCDRDRMQEHGVSLSRLLTLLQQNNLDMSVGRVDHDGGHFPVFVRERFVSIQDIRRLVVARGAVGPVRMTDIARVDFDFREKDSSARVNSNERIAVYVHKAGNADLLQLSRAVRQHIAADPLPEVSSTILYDQAETIRGFVAAVAWTVPLGLLLSWGVLFLFGASGSKALLALLAMPSSAAGCCLLLFMLRQDLNLITASGLLVGSALGLWPSISVALGGRLKSSAAYTTSTAIACMAFVPLVLSDADVRNLYGGFGVACAASLVLGNLYAFQILPAFQGNTSFPELRSGWIAALERLRGSPAAQRLLLQAGAVSRRPASALVRLIRARPATVLAGYALLLVGGLPVVSKIPFELVNPLEHNRIQGSIELPSGTSFESTDEIALKVERILTKLAPVREVTSRVEPGRATLNISLRSGYDAGEELFRTLTAQLGDIRPAFAHFSGSGAGGSASEITIDVLGEDLTVLDRITRKLAEEARSIPGATGIVLRYKSPRPELQLLIDRAKASMVGLTVADVGQRVRFALQGGVATKMIEDQSERDIRFRLPENQRKTLEDVQRLTLVNGEGRIIPVAELVRMRSATLPVKLYRKNKKRTFSFSLRPGTGDPDAIVRDIQNLSQARSLPPGYRLEVGSDYRKLQKARTRLGRLALMSAVLSLMLLCGITESVLRPLKVISALPLVLTPLAVGLLVVGQRMSVSLLLSLVVCCSLVIGLSMLEGDARRDLTLGREPSLAIGHYAALAAFFLPLGFMPGDAAASVRTPSLMIALVLVISALAIPATEPLNRFLGARAVDAARASIRYTLNLPWTFPGWSVARKLLLRAAKPPGASQSSDLQEPINSGSREL